MSDEYRPPSIHQGVLIKRYVPEGFAAAAGMPPELMEKKTSCSFNWRDKTLGLKLPSQDGKVVCYSKPNSPSLSALPTEL
jgi:hypothetical protein